MLIDIHVHAYIDPGPRNFSTPEQLIKRYDKIGVSRAVLLPLVSPEYYLPQSNEEILQIVENYPDRFVPFCNLDPRAITNTPEAPLKEVLKYYMERGCLGIGEVMPNLPFLDPLVQNLFSSVEDVGFPLIFDMSTRIGGAYGLYDDPGLPQLEECLKRFSDLTFLGHGPPFWAEIGTLDDPSDRSGYPKYPVRSEGAVPRLMREFENLKGDLSAGSGYNALARDPEYAVRFLNEFQDKLMFGTDICAPNTPTPLVDLLNKYRDDGILSKGTFDKIAYINASALLDI
jgi:hypothetical protein